MSKQLMTPLSIHFVLIFPHGRLISGSVGTVVYYGFQCNTAPRNIFLIICLLNGLAGTVIHFWDWFDRSQNKVCTILCHEHTSLIMCVSVEMAHCFLPLFDRLDHVGSSLTTLFVVFC